MNNDKGNEMAASFKDRPVGKILLAALGVVLGLVIAKFAFDAFANRPGNVEAQFDTAVQNDPNMGPMFKAMRDYFPTDYAALKAEMVAQHRAGTPMASISAIGFARMAAFRKSHLGDLAQAPSSELQAFRQSQATLLAQLAKESKAMCARYTFAALLPTDRPSPAGQKALADFGAVQFRAIAAGMKNPVKRDTDAPKPKDAEALAAQMKAEGLSDRHLATFLGAAGAKPLNETEQCDTGLALTNALTKLPVDQADRISAVLVTHS